MDKEEPGIDAEGQRWRTCEACNTPKPLTYKNFKKAKSQAQGFEFVCKSCATKIAQNRKLARLEAQSCRNFLEKAATGGSEIPHTSELLEGIMGLFGGANGFASMLASQYYAAPPGGRIRTQILEMVVKLTGKVAESGATRAPVALMSDDELEAEIEKRMATAVLSFKGQQILGIEQVPDGGRGVEVEDRRLA